MKLAAVFVLLLLAAPPAPAQEAGDWVFGIAVGTGERTGLFARFYPVADVGAEVHVLLLPIYVEGVGAGAGLIAHPFREDRVAVYLGGSLLESPHLGGGGGQRSFALGLGYEPFRGDDLLDRLMGRLSLSLARRRPFDAKVGVWGPWRLRPGGQVGVGRVVGAGVDETEGDPGAGDP